MFIPRSTSHNRFDLLLLGEDEYYFNDESVVFHIPTTTGSRPMKGRMKICSRSLFFEPQDEQLPIVKYDLKDVTHLESSPPDGFAVRTTRYMEARANNVIGPYVFVAGEVVHHYTLFYVQLSDFLTTVERLEKIAKEPRYVGQEKIAQIIGEREASTQFDISWLEHWDEKSLKEVHCVRVTPLVHNPGRLMITDQIVYFQPLNNVASDPVEKLPFRRITRVIKRRHSLRQIGLEIIMEEEYASKTPNSSFFAFVNESTRNSVFTLLTSQAGMTKLQHENQAQTTFRWQCGLISNYDYLMYLNSLADRTFNDLTQYPVMPWVIQDYESPNLDLENPSTYRDLSKPIGALNAKRFEFFKKRYEAMEEPKFLYGTHYSTPAYVLYYLVRVAPKYMLRLQNGRFDDANRLFCSIRGSWNSVTANSGDLKELIPEFYMLPGSFLVNSDNLKLGIRQDKTVVGDVELPPWASSTEDFIVKNRQALESEHVSANLPYWIDLIFGYKQQGSEAIAADNVFHPWTYEGVVDVEAIKDPIEREAMEVQIAEFGQTPKQIFTTPHPHRFSAEERDKKRLSLLSSTSSIPIFTSNILPLNSDFSEPKSPNENSPTSLGLANLEKLGAEMKGWENKIIGELEMAEEFQLHREKISGLHLSKNGEILYSVSHDTTLKIYDVVKKKHLRSMKISQLALSSCALSSDERNVFIGSWDNNVHLYSIDRSRVIDSLYAHDDAVSSLCLVGDLLTTGSWDTTVKVWKCHPSNITKAPLVEFVEHESEVKCVDMSKDENIVVSGSDDGIVYFSDTRTGTAINQIHAHTEEVSTLKLTDDGRLITAGKDKCLKIFDKHGQEIFQIDVGETLNCMAVNSDHVLIGGEEGSVRVWNLITTEEVEKHFRSGASAVSSIVASDNRLVILGDGEGIVTLWK